jgi:predicted NUDIX family NTP pyrophosphohydrolase
LMYRIHDGKLQVLLAHPGGPYFKNKYEGAVTAGDQFGLGRKK